MKSFIRLGLSALIVSLFVASTASTVTAAGLGFATTDAGNWTVDRYAPNSFNVTDNHLSVGISAADDFNHRPAAYTSGFYDTQGKSHSASATALGVDIYVDPSWSVASPYGLNVYSGLWAVGNDLSYPILNYMKGAPATSGDGFYMWDDSGSGSWHFLTGTMDGWHNLAIGLTASNFNFYVDGNLLGSTLNSTGTTSFERVIINTKNYGANYNVQYANLTDAPAAVPLPAAAYAGLSMLGALGISGWRKRKAAVAS